MIPFGQICSQGPLLKSSLMDPRTNRDMVKPRPIPRPFTKDKIGLFFDAKASALASIIQFTTLSGMNIPRDSES